MNINKIIVLFKTHLDIGFTDFSANVTKKYINEFIPNSISVANELKATSESRLIWTTGSWLIYEYLKQQPAEQAEKLRKAIADGDICWHGLPFTTHTELMSKELFEYGLSLSKRLDDEFGKKTVAAKLTDVPGHTKAIIPLLKKAGIEFLHIGVNPASTVPDVPPLFRWKADTGEEITVMYNDGYGKFSKIGNSGVAVTFAHTGDNAGVQSAEQIEKVYADIRAEYPNAEIIAGNLNDVAVVAESIADSLPVITAEIGDTWIHGVGTDPFKVSVFKGLERFWKRMPDCQDKEKLAAALIMIPEHTWGLNVHTNLGDHEHYDRDSFNEYRKTAANFRRMEESWLEQRNYLLNAVNGLSPENKNECLKIISQSKRSNGLKRYPAAIPNGTETELGGYKFIFNNRGEIVSLKNGDKVIADDKHRLCTLIYEQFCADDYERFHSQYNRCEEVWCYEDFTKPGIEDGSECYCRYMPQSAAVYPVDDTLLIRYMFPKAAHKKFGCPLAFDMIVSIAGGEIHFDLAWFCKPANRVAEALWFGFHPIAENKRISKLGGLIDPVNVVNDGQCRLHATDFGVVYNGLSVETLDTALVAPSSPSLLNFNNEKPSDKDGIYFNLYNNVWGTNFPMWYDEDARFRFIMKTVE